MGSSFLVFTSMDIKEYTVDELTLPLLHVTTAKFQKQFKWD